MSNEESTSKEHPQEFAELKQAIIRGDWKTATNLAINTPWDNSYRDPFRQKPNELYQVWNHIGENAGSTHNSMQVPMPEERLFDIVGHLKQGGRAMAAAKRRFYTQLSEHMRSGMTLPMNEGLRSEIVWENRHLPTVCKKMVAGNGNVDKKTNDLRPAIKFWQDYERDVQPHHFATIKSMISGKPETITDHRGATGTSADPELIKMLQEYAQHTQSVVTNHFENLEDKRHSSEPPIGFKLIRGVPHVLVYRGVSGNYGALIRDAFAPQKRNPDLPADYYGGTKTKHPLGLKPLSAPGETTYDVEDKTVAIPTAHLSSWSTDPSVSRDFAMRRIPGQDNSSGVILRQWKPIKDLLHAGYLNVVPNHDHVHEDERELIFKNEKGIMQVKPEDLHQFQTPETGWVHTIYKRPKIKKIKTPVVAQPASNPDESSPPVPPIEQPLDKAEDDDEIMRLIRHPNLEEGIMALKMDGVTPRHLAAAIDHAVKQVHPKRGNLIRDAITHEKADSALLHKVIENDKLENFWNTVIQSPVFGPEHARAMFAPGKHMSRFQSLYPDFPEVISKDMFRILANKDWLDKDAIDNIVKVIEPDYNGSNGSIGRLLQHPSADSDSYQKFFEKNLTSFTRNIGGPEDIEFQKVLRDPRLPSSVVGKLLDRDKESGAIQRFSHLWTHPNLPREKIDHVLNSTMFLDPHSNTTSSRVPAVAENPSLTDADVHNIIQHGLAVHGNHLVENPSLTAQHIDKILDKDIGHYYKKTANTADPSLLMRLSQHPNMTEEQLGRLHQKVKDTIAQLGAAEQPALPVLKGISKSIAQNNKTPLSVLEESYLNGSFSDRKKILEQERIPSDMLKRLVSAPEVPVSGAIEALTRVDAGMAKNVLNHPNANEEVLKAALSSPQSAIRHGALVSPKTNEADVIQAVKDAVQQGNPDAPKMRDSAIRRDSMSQDGMRAILSTAINPQDRMHVLASALGAPLNDQQALPVRSGRVPAEFFTEAASYPHVAPGSPAFAANDAFALHRALLQHPDHSQQHAEQFLNSPDSGLRTLAMTSKKLTPDSLRQVNVTNLREGLSVASSPNTPDDVLQRLVSQFPQIEFGKPDGPSTATHLHELIMGHKNASLDTLGKIADIYKTSKASRARDIVKGVDSVVKTHYPDVHQESFVDARLGKGGVGKLRALRDLILEKDPQNRAISPKQLPPGDWKAAQLPNGNISADKIQGLIDAIPPVRYGYTHTKWGTSKDGGWQRHSEDEQKVFQLNYTNGHVQQLKEAGLWERFKGLQSELTNESAHPLGPATLGWVRYTGGPTAKLPSKKTDPHGYAQHIIDEHARVKDDIEAHKTKLTEARSAAFTKIYDDAFKGAKERGLDDDSAAHHASQIQRNASDAAYSAEWDMDREPLDAVDKVTGLSPEAAELLKHKNALNKFTAASFGVLGEANMFRDGGSSDLNTDHYVNHIRQAVPEFMNPKRKHEPGIFIDEVQSDLTSLFNKKDDPEIVKMHNILFGGRHPSEVLTEGFLQHLRDKGLHDMKVQVHTPESKHHQLGELGHLKPGEPPPVHMKVGYEEVPKKQGFQPSTYGKLATQKRPRDKGDNVVNLDGQPTWEGKVKKFEQDLERFLAKAEDNLSDVLDAGAEVVQHMHGYKPHLERAFAAAKFLAGGKEAIFELVRHALWSNDGDVEAAALAAYGLVDSEANRKSLKAVMQMQAVQKAQTEPALPADTVVQAARPEAEDAAQAIRSAIAANQVLAVRLGGKHSKGSMVARDPESKKDFLLKPGSGQQSPAAGAREDSSSQSEREAAFWHVAKAWGLADDFPRAELLIIGGLQYACMSLLSWQYQPMERVRDSDPSEPGRTFERYRVRGRLHMWAVLDFVLGNPDRHAQNIMVNETRVKLIDHGSAFAGIGFDPSFDQNSFVPFYLRYTVPQRMSFNSLSPKDKLKYMQTVSAPVKEVFREWIRGLDGRILEEELPKYGIDPAACLQRLHQVKNALDEEEPDVYINKLWVGT